MKRFQIASLFKGIEPLKSISIPSTKKPRKPRRKRGIEQANSQSQAQQKKPEIKKPKATPYKKQRIPVALREQVWIKQMGKVFEGKCPTTWCQNTITVYDFQSGHNIPESKGGPTTLDNLVPLCSRCNLSMGNEYTFDEWSKISDGQPPKMTVEEVEPKKWWCC
jgi:5-methylcytosine-specific restriction endonuclease McrA